MFLSQSSILEAMIVNPLKSRRKDPALDHF